MKKSKLIKSALFLIVALSTGFLIWWYINKYLTKPKATVDSVSIKPSSDYIKVGKNQEFTVNFQISATNEKKISGASLTLIYDKVINDNLEYLGFSQVPDNYFNEVISEIKIPNLQGLKVVYVTLVAKKPAAQLSSNIVLGFKFRSKDKDSFSQIGFG